MAQHGRRKDLSSRTCLSFSPLSQGASWHTWRARARLLLACQS